MTLPAPVGLAAAPSTLTPGPVSFDRLLLDLRRASWADPATSAWEIVKRAAAALGADALVVWLRDNGGVLQPMVHDALGPVSCTVPSLADVAGERPDESALAREGLVERAEGPLAVLDAAIWVHGALAGAVCAKRGGTSWSEAERAFVVGVGDRLAVEAVAERGRLAERTLRERAQQMDLLEQIAGLGSWEIDLRTDAITWSREQSRIHGVEDATRPRTHTEFLRMVHPDDRRIIDDGMARLAGRGPVMVEFRIVRPDGKIRLLQAQGLLVPSPDGEYSRVIGTSLDITERRATELALRASEESYRTIFDSSNDAIFVQDLETGAILDANRRACEGTACTLDELRASGLSIIANGPAPFTPERAKEHFRRAAAGEAVRFEWMNVQRVTGEPRWQEVSLQRVTIRGEDRLLALVRDIADRKRAELALQASEESYRTIFDSSNDAIFVHDVDTGAILDANRSACEFSDATLDELRANGLAIITNAGPPFTPEAAIGYMQRAAAGEPVRFEWVSIHRRTGDELWVEVSLQRVTIRGEPRILALVRDIRDRKRVEQALRRSEENYRGIFENAADAMWMHDVDTGAFLEVNKAAEEIYGYTAEEQKAGGVPLISDKNPPYTAEQSQVYLKRAAAGEPQRFEWLCRHKDGRPVWNEVRLRRVTIGGVDRILATARDINDRKAAEQQLRASEESYRTIFQNASDAMWLHDVDTGAFLDVNNAAVELYGFAAEEQKALGTPGLSDGRPPYTAERARGYMRQAAAGLTPRFEWLGRHKDGSPVWAEVRLRRVTIGGVDRILATARDINDRKRAEAALREANEVLELRVQARTAQLAAAEEHFRRLIENTSDFVMIVDETAAITYVGPSVTRMLGYQPEEIMGTRPADLVHPDDVDHVMRDFQWILEHPGEPYTSTFRIRHKDGSYRVFENLGRTLSPHSVAEGVVANGRDITDRMLAAEALARAKEEAERANRAKSEFLSRMSHELRTPMNSILGFGQLLARADLPPQQAKSVQHILKAGRHLLNLINEVLEIARIEAGREHFSLEPVALGAVLQEAVGLVRPLAQQWEVELREGAWPRDAFVQADRQRLVQVLLNLLSNAIKYNRRGGYVRLSAASVPAQTGSGGRWVVRVEDSGRGIPEERAGQLFTPFARLGAEQTDVEGTGLGLALSQRLCEAMGGALALERTSSEGSVFRVDLGEAADPLGTLEETGTYPVPAGPHRTATLLYVEDNLANLSLVDTILLSRPGWRTLPALQGQLGVELAREHVPDVILLDLHLPDMPGEEVLRRLRADERTAAIPIVVVSADATPSSLERLRIAGANAYLTKPLDVDEFLRVVERLLPPVEGTGA